ncbi:MAG: hypothetical protein U0930_01950 [Pirellulales bacterium]
MKTSFRFTLFLLSVCSVSRMAFADDLFSEVAMESVFEKKAAPVVMGATQSDGESLERVTGVASLSQALKYAGYAPKENAGRVSIQVPHAGWNFPADLQVQLESDRIVVEMALVTLADSNAVQFKELLKLLEKNDAVTGFQFAYEPSRKLLVLRSALENRALSPKKIQTHLTLLAAFGEKHSSIWSPMKPKSADQSASKTGASNVASTVPAGLSLVGTWGAALKDKDSIAIQIKEDTTFKLVTVQADKHKISTGKCVREGTRMSLVGDDGVTLQCTVSQSVANQFQLFVHDEQGNAKLKVDFQKAN